MIPYRADDCYGRDTADRRYTEGVILSGKNYYGRTHLWRDRQGAEGANSLSIGIISQAKGQSI